MELGTFSVSLAVGDMGVSRSFYERLGFEMIGGDGESWTIMANGATVVGLFQGMFEGNILTFNPGWQGPAEPAEEFTDIRDIRDQLGAAGIDCLTDTTSERRSGPASLTIADPDGNVILLDQHVCERSLSPDPPAASVGYPGRLQHERSIECLPISDPPFGSPAKSAKNATT